MVKGTGERERERERNITGPNYKRVKIESFFSHANCNIMHHIVA